MLHNRFDVEQAVLTHAEGLRRYLLSRVASGCRRTYVSLVHRVLGRFVAKVDAATPADVEPHDIVSFLADMTSTHKASTVKSYRAILLSHYTWLVTQGLIPTRDWQKAVGRVRADCCEPRSLTVAQCEQLVTGAECLKYRSPYTAAMSIAWVYLLLDTGLRVSELTNLRMSDIDTHARVLRVSAESKARRERQVWFSTRTAAKVRAYLRLRRSKSDWLWVTTHGTKPSRGRVLQYIKHLGEQVGMPWLTVHTLRHTCATMLLRNGMSLEGVRMVLGHTQLRTTERYLHLLREDVQEQYRTSSPVGSLGCT